MLTFTHATKQQAKARIALIGPSGSGKTYTALRIATALDPKVALIDTERGSASKYADQFQFDTLNLDSFAPATYVEAIQAAERAGYNVLVIDSLSHAWTGVGGALEMVDRIAKRSQSGNNFAAWRDVTPEHNRLVDTILRSNLHVIATMRAKTEYVLETNERGKNVPKKVGMAPVQRDGMEYEFDIVGDMDLDHNLIISKTRCPALDAQVVAKPGKPFADIVLTWLSDGAAPLATHTESKPETPAPELFEETTETRHEDKPTAVANSTTFWALANKKGMKTEANRIYNKYTTGGDTGKTTNWKAAQDELLAVAA